MPVVYDDKKEDFDLWEKELQASKKEAKDEAQSPEELNAAESTGNAPPPNQDNFSYTGGNGKKKDAGKGNGNKKLLAIAGGATVLLVGLVLLLLYLGSLMIPNFTSHILTYQFARVARETATTHAKLTGQKIAIDSASDNAFQQAVNKYKNLKNNTWEKINNYRPKKLVDRFQSTGQMDFQYSDPKGLFNRMTLQRIVTGDGKVITIPQNAVSTLDQIRSPIDYIKAKFQARRDIKVAVNDALRGRNFYLRAKTAKAVRAKINVKLYAWSKTDLEKYRGQSTQNSDVENAKQSYRTATNNGEAPRKAGSGSSSKDIKEGQAAALEEMDSCLAQNSCIQQVVQQSRAGQGSVPPNLASRLVTVFDSNALSSFLSVASPAYAVALPLCLIYDGSIVSSQGVIDANSEEAQRSFYRVASAADQQKVGEANGEAIGAMTRQLGQIGRSNAEKRASGIPVDTIDTTVNAQASAAGGFSTDIFDTFLPSGAATVIRSVASPLCSVMTSPWTGVALVAANLLPGVGPALQGAGQVTMRTIVGVLGRQLAITARQFVAKRNLAKLGAIIGATVVGTIIAKSLVMQHIAQGNNGLAQHEEYANQIDNGGNLAGNDMERQQNLGVPLSNEQVNNLRPLDTAYNSQEKQNQSIYDRYFALTNPGSVANEAGVKLATTLRADSLASLVSGGMRLLNPLYLFGQLLKPFQSPKLVSAANGSNVADYNNVQWGWTPEEEQNFENNPAYQLLPNQEILDASGKQDEITLRYGKCYAASMGILLAGEDGGSPSIYRDDNGNIIPNQGDCSPLNLGMHNPEYGDLVYRWRVAIRYGLGLDNLLDAQGGS